MTARGTVTTATAKTSSRVSACSLAHFETCPCRASTRANGRAIDAASASSIAQWDWPGSFAAPAASAESKSESSAADAAARFDGCRFDPRVVAGGTSGMWNANGSLDSFASAGAWSTA